MQAMQQKVEQERIQKAMGTFLMEQYKRKKAMETKQMQGLGKIGRLLTDKVKENFVSEI